MANHATVKIFRFDPSVDEEPRYENYQIPYEYWHGVKVIDTLRYVYEKCDPGLSFREPCRQQVCGACVVLVNQKPVLACDTFSEKEMVIEPVSDRPILKDLVIDFQEEKG
jgi:succinate dehydrogenase / fumarate reductase iron-sulfur subunit